MDYSIYAQLTRGVKFTSKAKSGNNTTFVANTGVESNNFHNTENSNGHSEMLAMSTNSSLPVSTITSKRENNSNIVENTNDTEMTLDSTNVEPSFIVPPKKTEQNARPRKDNNAAASLMERGLNTRKKHSITVSGNNLPWPINSFNDLQSQYQVSFPLVANLCSVYKDPTPVQMQAIPIMLIGRNLYAQAPTGSGKTVAYLVPLIHDLKKPMYSGFRAIILAPTRELAQQIDRECKRLCSDWGPKTYMIKKNNHPAMNKKYDILITTPNRLRHLLIVEPPAITLENVQWIIIDEADRLLADLKDNDFKYQLEDIVQACSNQFKNMALFTATKTNKVAKWCRKNLKNVVRLSIGSENTASLDVEQKLIFVGDEHGKFVEILNIIRSGISPPILIFVQSKDRAQQLFEELLCDQVKVGVIHADRTPQQRDISVKEFREGQIWVLICTDLMGRGMDFKGVNLVINYDVPINKTVYIHRVGRAGRAGLKGTAITFYTTHDILLVRSIAQIIKNSGGKVEEYLLKMPQASKSKLKMLEKNAPKRELISTEIKPENTVTKKKRKTSI